MSMAPEIYNRLLLNSIRPVVDPLRLLLNKVRAVVDPLLRQKPDWIREGQKLH